MNTPDITAALERVTTGFHSARARLLVEARDRTFPLWLGHHLTPEQAKLWNEINQSPPEEASPEAAQLLHLVNRLRACFVQGYQQCLRDLDAGKVPLNPSTATTHEPV